MVMTQPKGKSVTALPFPVALAGQMMLEKGKTGSQYLVQAVIAVSEDLAGLSQKLHDFIAENAARSR